DLDPGRAAGSRGSARLAGDLTTTRDGEEARPGNVPGRSWKWTLKRSAGDGNSNNVRSGRRGGVCGGAGGVAPGRPGAGGGGGGARGGPGPGGGSGGRQ